MPNYTIFTDGGNVQANKNGLYIARHADEQLLQLCAEGVFAYVLTSRQLGKSSLIVRTAEQLQAEYEIQTALVDLSDLGQTADAEQWYSGLIRTIAKSIGGADLRREVRQWWSSNADMGYTERLIDFLENFLLNRINSKIVIFIDEIDTTLNLDFSDDFFAAIRGVHNKRATSSIFHRLSFVLVGVATPNELMSDPSRTPFNIGKEVILTDFTLQEAKPLSQGFGFEPHKAQQVLSWVLEWTHGHPFLTQKLCIAVAEAQHLIETSSDVDKIVYQTFFNSPTEDNNLQFVRDTLTLRAPEQLRGEILGTYRQVRRKEYVADIKNAPAISQLKLSGIVTSSDRRLRVRNRIYEEVFSIRWINETASELGILLNLPEDAAQPLLASDEFNLPESYTYVIEADDNPLSGELLTTLSEAGLHALNKKQLESNYPNQQGVVQAAIKFANAIILIATPEVPKSLQIQAELNFVEISNKPLWIVWAKGDEWINCVPLSLAQEQYIDLRGGRFTRNIAVLIEHLHTGTVRDTTLTDTVRNPYKGLRPFTTDDKRDFFGRTELITNLINDIERRLQRNEDRFLGVIGASGSGKSSIVMAGLIPALQQGALPDSGLWIYVDPIIPGIHPIDTLITALGKAYSANESTDIYQLVTATDGYGLSLVAQKHASYKTVIFIDQFEELFTLTSDPEEREHFIKLLVKAASDPTGSIIVIIALRADFYDRPMQYNELGKLVDRYSRNVLPMTYAEFQEAIVKPASQKDVRLDFEPELLSNLLSNIHDLQNALPLLQFTLDQLFDRRAGNMLTLNAYEAIGGINGALSRHAQETYDQLPSDTHRDLARALFIRLVEPGETINETTRRRANLDEFQFADTNRTATMQEVCDAFVASRLLVTNIVGTQATVEVGHEALIREWNVFGQWIENARNDIRIQKAVNRDAAAWVQRGSNRQDDTLYRGTVLDEAERWSAHNIPSLEEAEFLQASRIAQDEREKRDRQMQQRIRQLRLAAGVFAVVGVVALILTIFSFVQSRAATRGVATANVAAANANTQAASANTQAADASTQAAVVNVTVAILNDEATSVQGNLAVAQSNLDEAEQRAETAIADANSQQRNAALSMEQNVTAQAESDALSTQAAELINNVEEQSLLVQNIEQTATETNRQLELAATAQLIAQLTQAAFVDDLATAQAEQRAAIANVNIANQTLTPVSQILAAAEVTAAAAGTIVGDANAVLRLQAQGTDLANSQVQAQLALQAAEARITQAVDAVSVAREDADQIRNSLRLALDAQRLAVQGDPTLALALARYAALLSSEPFVQSALAELAYNSRANMVLTESGDFITDIVAVPQSDRFISAGCGSLSGDDECIRGEIILWQSLTAIRADMNNPLTATGQRILYSQPIEEGYVRDLAINADGSRIAAAVCRFDEGDECRTTIIIVWDVAQELQEVLRIETELAFVDTIALHPTESLIAFGGCAEYDEDEDCVAAGDVIIWDIALNQVSQRFATVGNWVDALAFSPRADRLAVSSCIDETTANGCSDADVFIWDLVNNGQVMTLDGHTNWVEDVAFVDDTHLLSASSDRTVRLWDLQTTRTVHTFTGHSSAVNSVSISPNRLYAVSASDDNALIVWDIEQGKQVQRLEGHGGDVRSVVFMGDDTLVSGAEDDRVMVWDFNLAPRLHTFYGHDDWVNDVEIAPDGSIAVSASDDRTLIVWNTTTGEPIYRLVGHNDWVNDVAIHPNGQIAVSASCARRDAEFDDCIASELFFWDIRAGLKIGEIHDESGTIIWDMEYSPDGQRLVTGTCEEFNANDLCLRGLATVRNAADGTPLMTLAGHEARVAPVSFSPDGTRILTGSCVTDAAKNCLTGEIIEWDAVTGAELRRFGSDHEGFIWGLSYSPDGQSILSASQDNTLILWDADSLTPLQSPWLGHEGSVYDVHFHPNGQVALSTSNDDTLILWNVATGELLARYFGHTANTDAVAFSPDGTYAISASGDGTLIKWEIHDTSAELLYWVDTHRNIRELTCGERLQFGVQPFCDEYVAHSLAPELTVTPGPDFALTSPTPTPTMTTEPVTVTPTPQLVVSAAIRQALESAGLALNSGYLAETVARREVTLVNADNALYYGNSNFWNEYDNFVLGATINWGQMEAEDSCGYRFRTSADRNNYYYMEITHDGQLIFTPRIASTWGDSIQSFAPPVNTADEAANSLVLIAIDDTFSVYLNGIYVARFTDTRLHEGDIYFSVSVENESAITQCIFTDAWVWDITDTSIEPLPAPPPPEQVAQVIDSLSNVAPLDGELVLYEPNILVDASGFTRANSWEWHYLDGNYSNFLLHTTIAWSPGALDDDCGIIFRRNNLGDYARIVIERDNALWYTQYVDSNTQDWIEGSGAALETAADARNNLTLVVINDRVDVYINGQYASQFVADASTEGEVILYARSDDAGDTSTCEFTDTWIWQITLAEVGEGTVTGEDVNLRRAPSTASTSLTLLPLGTRITILDQNSDGSWLFVRTESNQQGWVWADLIRRNP